MHALDRPVWSSLAGRHHALGDGDALARRYRPDVNVFAATPHEGAEALLALAGLMPAGAHVYLLQVPAIVVPPGLRIEKAAVGVQMVAGGAVQTIDGDPPLEILGDADAPEMLALARLTEPGPFLERTHTMGRFVGIRFDGRLVAMAGERMRPDGHTEISGVCTHPDCRGQGLARRLSAAVAAAIQARGEIPFLHAWASNQAAISLYASLGFVQRAEVQVAVLVR